MKDKYPDVRFKAFEDPPADFRSVPFWSLNDRLEPEEIKRQLGEFKKGGFGGAYLHSRIGLLTEYLGEDWWKAMDAGVEACETDGLEAWFYDEDKWPSGFAGGIVPLMSEEYHARCLLRIDKEAALPEASEVLGEDDNYRYICYKVKMGDSWFNGTCWVDLMNPDMVKAFIDCSYRPYAERYEEQMGHTAKGIFTDEPQVSPRAEGITHKGAISYSPFIREAFKRQHGYDLADHLACLFENSGNYRKVRLDYYRTLAAQFEDSFSQQIGEYCEQTGMVWTGHYNGEENLLSVLQNVGNMMIQYRHMQRPGMDHLGLHIKGGLNAAKSLSSVANQYGRTRRLSELFGISGQNMNFEDRKWIGDWHAALGVNHFCPHLSLYSMKGCRKRDYPPTLSPQQPYWSYNKMAEDYMARVCYLSSCGQYAAEMVVIHPLESAYVEYQGGYAHQDVMKISSGYDRVLDVLQRSHRNYDLGDECILSDVGSVEGDTLQIGEMTYRAVLLPFMRTIRRSTLALLEEFADAGGRIIAVGNYPEYVDGEKEQEALMNLQRISRLVAAEELSGILEAELPPAVKLQGENQEKVYIHQRRYKNGQILQLSNTSRLEKCDLKVWLDGEIQNPVLWEPGSGQCLALEAEEDAFSIRLAPAQTLFITTGDPSSEAQVKGKYQILQHEEVMKSIDGPWKGRRLDLNAITLDFARFSVDGGESFSAPEPIIGIHQRLTDKGYCGELQLLFEVDAAVSPRACELVLEQPEIFKCIKINGQSMDFADEGFYRDISFRRTSITSYLKEGLNTILLVVDYTAPIPDSLDAATRYGTEIESIYLVGDFGVETVISQELPAPTQKNLDDTLPSRDIHRIASFKLTEEKKYFEGDLALQGYPFYNGGFELVQDFQVEDMEKDGRYFLKLPEIEAVVVQCEVNGVELPPIAWSPWETDVTSALRPGMNRLKITLVNSLRNLLGPHHHCQGELTQVGPVSFSGRSAWPDQVQGERNWYDLRSEGKANKWRDDYHIIPLGLLKAPLMVRKY